MRIQFDDDEPTLAESVNEAFKGVVFAGVFAFGILLYGVATCEGDGCQAPSTWKPVIEKVQSWIAR